MLASIDRAFVPGTVGWSVDHLDDRRWARLWERDKHEIADGVLTTLPPQLPAGGSALVSLSCEIIPQLEAAGVCGGFAVGTHLVLRKDRVARADLVYVTDAQKRGHAAAARNLGRDPRLTYFLVPPTLVIESLTPDFEAHDRRTKRAWYAQAGVKHFWLLDAYRRQIECLELKGSEYVTRTVGRKRQRLAVFMLTELTIELKDVWSVL